MPAQWEGDLGKALSDPWGPTFHWQKLKNTSETKRKKKNGKEKEVMMRQILQKGGGERFSQIENGGIRVGPLLTNQSGSAWR